MNPKDKKIVSDKLVKNAQELGFELMSDDRKDFFNYKGMGGTGVDLSASAEDKLSILKNVVQQYAVRLENEYD